MSAADDVLLDTLPSENGAAGDVFADAPASSFPGMEDETESEQNQDRPTNLVDFPTPAPMELVDYNVTYDGIEFTPGELDTEGVMRLLNIVGQLGIRSEQVVGQNLRGLFLAIVNSRENGRDQTKTQAAIPFEATMFGLFSILRARDIVNVGVVVLFGGSDAEVKEGLEFFKKRGFEKVKIAPIIKALSIRIAQSEDLREALGNLPLVQSSLSRWSSLAR